MFLDWTISLSLSRSAYSSVLSDTYLRYRPREVWMEVCMYVPRVDSMLSFKDEK